jgi:hypothetical protein
MRAWADEGAQVPLTVQVAFGKLEPSGGIAKRAGTVVPVVTGQTYALAATVGRRAIAFALAGAADAGERWTDEFRNPFVMREGDNVAEVVLLRPLAALKRNFSQRESADFAEAVRRFREIDQVVLDCLVNNVIQNGTDASGHAFASYDSILDARGVEKKKKGGYSAGHRPEDREEVHHSILRLIAMGAGITRIDAKNRKGRLPPALVAHDYEFDMGSGAATGVEYELGKWFDALNLDTVPFSPVETLQYDLRYFAIEQRLARLFVNLTFTAPNGVVARVVRDVLREVNLQVDAKKPGRTMERFKKAMDRLVTDGVLASWRYDPDDAHVPFEARGFLTDWLSRELVVTRGERVTSGRPVLPP